MISADRSKRGILFPGSPAFKRQEAYAKEFGDLSIIGFSRKADGAKYVDAGQLRVLPTNSAWRFFYALDAIRLAKSVPKPDVVTVQDPFETGLVGWWIARKFGVPLHVQVHTDFLSPEYARLSFLNRIRARIARFILGRADGIRVVSSRIKQSLQTNNYRLKTIPAVLPIFTDLARLPVRSDLTGLERFQKFAWKILVVSRLEPEKNVALATRSFARSAPHDACLIILGAGSEMQTLKHFAKRLNVADRVFFEEGFDIGEFYKLADLVLVPSKYEGYGLVTIEALAAGKPVLSTDVGIAREAGAIVTTEEKFADALAEWFESGPRMGALKHYPYKNFDEYVRAYCADIEACIRAK